MSFKEAWLADNLSCPACRGPDLSRTAAAWVCATCSTEFEDEQSKANFITKDFTLDFKISENPNASDHAYNPSALRFIEECGSKGGMALDCGSGLRSFTSAHLLQTEIMPYPNVDILAVAQKLPFKDEAFDVVLSFDVLEHVTDPFASAAELSRVLKPGGYLYIDLPFLQLEHGYPHHYFNATRMGLRKLFDPYLAVQAHVVPQSGHPAHLVWQAINTYRNGLAPHARADFEARPIGDIIAAGWKALRDRPGGGIVDSVMWRMASATQAVFRKDTGTGAASNVVLDVSYLPNFAGRKSRVTE